MSTFASDFIEGFDARWSEVDTLIDMAQGLDDGDKEYCALCRATIVLIVANFEGFIYEAMRCFIKDVNSNNAFFNYIRKNENDILHSIYYSRKRKRKKA